jgi:hypothetical protein
MMGQIYARAERVLAWLGEDFDDVGEGEMLFAFFRMVFQRREKLQKVTNYASDPTWAEITDEFEKTFEGTLPRRHRLLLGSLGFDSRVIEIRLKYSKGMDEMVQLCLWRLFTRTYFERRWVLQEIFRAKSVELHCGISQIDWYELNVARDIMRHLGFGGEDGSMNLFQPLFLINALHNAPACSSAENILYCMLMFWETKCLDIRDRLYALLSFSEHVSIRADYTIAPLQLWCHFAHYCVKEGLALRLIEIASQQTTRDKELPSWVPDFGATEGYRRNRQMFEDPLPHVYWKPKSELRPEPRMDSLSAQNRLSCTISCFGMVVIHDGWAYLELPGVHGSQSQSSGDMSYLQSRLASPYNEMLNAKYSDTTKHPKLARTLTPIYNDSKSSSLCLSLTREVDVPEYLNDFRKVQFVPCGSILRSGDLLCALEDDVPISLRLVNQPNNNSSPTYRVHGRVGLYENSGFSHTNFRRVEIM